MSITKAETNVTEIARYGGDCLASSAAPIQLLTNGRLTSVLTATGAGYVQLGAVGVTRWRADPTGRVLGCHVYLRDLETQEAWSLGFHPTCQLPDGYDFQLTPGAATLERVDHDLVARLEACVHPEWDFDVRRCTLTNRSHLPRAIEVTSYAEVTLQDAGADAAHPAFSNLFIQTACTPSGILHARRRPRRGDEQTLSACHLLIGDEHASRRVEMETDRRRFIGRGRDLRSPLALSSTERLSGSLGPVLDPVFSLRTTLVVPAGGSASIVLALGAGESHSQLLEAAERLAGTLDFDQVRRSADRAAEARYQELGIKAGDLSELLAHAASRLYGFSDADDEPAQACEFLALHQIADRKLPQRANRSPTPGAAAREASTERRTSVNHAGHSATKGGLSHGVTPTGERLLFENGLGGFTPNGREYVLTLAPRASGELNLPPLPWNNIIANEQAGFITSERGAGYAWTANSRLNRLTPWFNDSVVDPHSEAVYLRDEATGEFWSLTPGPTPHCGSYQVRHGWGYTTFRHTHAELEHEVTQFVPREDGVKITRLRLINRGATPRRLRLAAYALWELSEGQLYARLATKTEIDAERGVVLATNAERGEFSTRTAFAALAVDKATYQCSADHDEFVGPHGHLAAPQAIAAGSDLTGRCGAGLDPCAAIQTTIVLEPGQTLQAAFLLGEEGSKADALAMVEKYRTPAHVDEALAEAQQFWQDTLSAVHVETPCPALDVMVNGWLPYQNLSCRVWGRSSSYQSGGAFGFRDQLQDAAALVHHLPELTRRQVLLNAAHQFVEGDVLHWWHPPQSRGIRTIFSDDLLWLPLAASEYVQATGDESLWQEEVRFLTAEPVPAGHPEIYLTPRDSGERGTLFEHCCRALDRGLTRGVNGLPLMGCGDWNDGMNRIGLGGAGESVWLGFFIDYILERFLPVCRQFGDDHRHEKYSAYREQLRTALNDAGWDGQWYRRAYFDDGTPVGTAAADECKIDALVQAWAVLSGAAPPERAAQAIAEADRRLVDEAGGIIRLLDPPFNAMAQDPGYIKGYLPGVRENGGQYTHGVLWLVRAIAELGQGTRAWQLLEMLSPVSHGCSPETVATYKAEPYVVAADVYGQPPHVGRAGWPWYTGSAGWMFRVAFESLLGIHLEGGDRLRIDPRIAASWPECRVRYRLADRRTAYNIHIQNPRGQEQGVTAATLDGEPFVVGSSGAIVPLVRDGRVHDVVVVL